MAAVHVHHGAARCLLALFDAAAGGSGPWSEFDAEAERWGVDPRVSREDLEALVEGSTRELPAADHHRLHQDAGDFALGPARGATHPRPLRPPILLAAGPPALGPHRGRGGR